MAYTRVHKVAILEESTAGDLETAINAWFAASGNAQLVTMLYQNFSVAKYSVIIVYVED